MCSRKSARSIDSSVWEKRYATRFHCQAIVAPEWLGAHSGPEWVDRYAGRLEEARHAWAEQGGKDGRSLLSAVFDPSASTWLREVPAVELVRRVWVQNYQWTESKLGWRSSGNIPPAGLYISSPYDPDAHYRKKRRTSWVGDIRASDGNLRAGQPAPDHPCRNYERVRLR